MVSRPYLERHHPTASNVTDSNNCEILVEKQKKERKHLFNNIFNHLFFDKIRYEITLKKNKKIMKKKNNDKCSFFKNEIKTK